MTHLPPPSPDSPPLRRPHAGAPELLEPTPSPAVTVRVTQPDLARRAQLERSRGRLVVAALGFGALFLAVAMKATWSTVIAPAEPKRTLPAGAGVEGLSGRLERSAAVAAAWTGAKRG